MNLEKLRTLWDAHARVIHACLLQVTRSPQDASDLLQDVFCRLARQPELLAGLPEEPRGFLLRLARNLAIDHVRRMQVRDRVYEKVQLASREAIDAEDPDNPLLKQALAAALEQLPPEQRDVVHDRLWKRRTLDEIAVARGISINTAASRYRYGLNKMREHLRPLYADFSHQPLSTPDPAMKINSPDPIIRPLDPRRVPSATGAFALPALPMPEEGADFTLEEVDATEFEAEIEIIDVPIEGDEAELPISFEEAIKGLDEVPADGDLDVVWAYEEVFMTMIGDGETSEEEGDETDEEDDGEGDLGGRTSDGEVKGGSSNPNIGEGFILDGTHVTVTTGIGSTSSLGGGTIATGSDVQTPSGSDTETPDAEVLVTGAEAAPAAQAAAAEAISFAEGAAFSTHDLAPEESASLAPGASTPVSFAAAPIAAVSHEVDEAAAAVELANDSVSAPDSTVSATGIAVAADAIVDQWVPLPADAASDSAPHVILTESIEPALASAVASAPEAGGMTQSTVNHGVLAMAVVGAALAAHDPKTSEKRPLRNLLAILVAFLSLLATGLAETTTEQPSIAGVRGRVVTVTVPAGFDSVSLQKVRVIQRARTRERVWATVDTQFPAGEARTLSYRLTKLTPKRNLRVIGSRSAPLPENFLTGVTSFGGDLLSLANSGSNDPSGRSNDGAVTLSGNSVTTTAGVDSAGGSTPASVVESDIWKIDGDRLYYFNQLRGLQVIDVKNPDDPSLLGTLRMPAAGEDLYLVDEDHVALLKRSNNWYWGGPIRILNAGSVLRLDSTVTTFAATGTASPGTSLLPYSEAERTNELVIADVSAGAPVQVASVEFKGALNESRLVGQVLYVATSTSRETAGGGTEYGTEVIAFDLSDPANPAERDSVFIPGWASMVTATPEYFVVTGGWPNSLQLVDISAGDGTLALAGSVTPEGYIADKFKIDIDAGVLTVLSQVWLPWAWNNKGEIVTRGGPQTVLQTFSLADANAPTQLGRIVIAPGETLRATRFDDDRVYVVTFEQIDPLHIVDLSDPANPVVSGEVEAPGFSTYIEPLGDRLVTIGLVDWQPAVSLFDVSDPSAPALLQQLKLGGRNDGWAHSEAVWNEKAFKVLAQHNLVLLPISGYDRLAPDNWGGEWFSRVQLIDLKRDSLEARGVIDAGFSPRRADIVKANRIAAISPSKLVVVNAGNRDHPFVTAELELAWSVDRVFHVGNHLVQIGGSADWTGKPAPTLAVSPASTPDDTLTLVDLDPLDVVGATLKDGTLFLAQRAWPRWWINDNAESKPQLLVTAYDVSALPALRKLSQASGPAPVNSWGNLTPLWPSPGTLVWAADGHYYSYSRGGDVLASGGTISLAANTARLSVIGIGWWWGSWTKQFISFNVGAPERIAYGSTVELKPRHAANFSTPFAQAGLVFISEQQYWDNNLADDASDAGRHFLRVIDYSEPAAPYIRDERVNIPGRLAGVARDGRLLYTVGCDFDTTTGRAKDTAALHASAFNGSVAHLIATLPLAGVWSPVGFAGPSVVTLDEQPAYVWKPFTNDPDTDDAVEGGTLKLAVTSIWWGGSYEENPRHSTLRIAQLTDAGSFTELGALELAHDSGLHLFGDLAVTQPDWHSVRAIDLSNTLAPADLGAFSLPGNVSPNLDGADGALGVGLWIPAGVYGIETLGLGE